MLYLWSLQMKQIKLVDSAKLKEKLALFIYISMNTFLYLIIILFIWVWSFEFHPRKITFIWHTRYICLHFLEHFPKSLSHFKQCCFKLGKWLERKKQCKYDAHEHVSQFKMDYLSLADWQLDYRKATKRRLTPDSQFFLTPQNMFLLLLSDFLFL